ncbi:o-succinylbenzoate synthase [Candidatus Neomarinimicrobiota bacterium]
MILVDVRTLPYNLPLREPFRTASTTFNHRSGWIVQLWDDQGHVGQGDCAPLPGMDMTSLASYAECVRGLSDPVLRSDLPIDPDGMAERLEILFPELPALRFALETALLDLVAQWGNISLARQLDHEAQGVIQVNAVVPLGDVEERLVTVKKLLEQGFHTLKIKLGGRQDASHVAAIRAAAGENVVLRLDANGAWDRETALKILGILEPMDIEYVEQPVPKGNLEILAAVASASPIAIAADEDACDPESIRRILDSHAAHVIVLKPAILGGLLRCRDLAFQVREAGIKAVITTSFESVVGRTAATHLAAACGTPGIAHGLATGSVFVKDLAPDPVTIKDGIATLPDTPGLGVSTLSLP